VQARAAWAALRLLADVADVGNFFFADFRFGANDGARAFGANDRS
jgi:hypothetical protein